MRPRFRRSSDQRGYSLIEIMFVLAIMGILSGMAVIQISTNRNQLVGDAAMRVVMGQLTRARELAITQRKFMRVSFDAPNLVRVLREDTTTTTTLMSSGEFENGVTFGFVSGLPDTTDSFGSNSAGIYFGAAVNVKFSPDGTFVDQDGRSINGSVFIAQYGQKTTARAITLMGATGRVRAFKWEGNGWRIV